MSSPIADDELVNLWHGKDTAAEIAKKYGIKPKNVLNAWRRLKSQGKLPKHERQCNKRQYFDVGNNLDGRPTVASSHSDDPLIDALSKAHAVKER